MLEAIAAPSRSDELALHRIEIEANAPAEQDVEVLERDVRHVGIEQPGEGREIGTKLAAPFNALEPGVEIEGHDRAHLHEELPPVDPRRRPAFHADIMEAEP